MIRRATLVLAMLGALLIGLSASPVLAQDTPPPRPTLPPGATPEPSMPPSATPEPTPPPSVPPADSAPPPPPTPGDAPPAVQPGRIVGTVIDLRTGAPTPGVSVAIGNLLVVTDANGNYDSADLPPGAYPVTLVLQPEQGVAAENTVVVTVPSGARIVRHLGFYSPEPSLPPSAEPSAAPSLAPTAAPAPQPAEPPAGDGATPPAARVVPLTLPDTAAPQRAAWPLMLAALLALGSGVWLLARRAHLRRR
ncbi:carboxypeptidase regulatory-like domain-containing protein [Kallotenue papyrolyticum]|uniref:carboxypeptidase regulatory-like domain-containing protein n=1 Tax=Kallotenue papyrolyticum TaxID=1325125 RepID=UPI000492A88A|nr:carboxypeptidase regulatory-like domain-containing protein [Kallotenue papyrolyticum]